MAEIDDLIADVDDAVLREQLGRAADALKQNKRFGLVYEEHIPETVALPGVVPRVDDLVQLRSALGKEIYRVEAVVGNTATIRIRKDSAEAETQEAILSDLAVVKRFGEAIYPGLTSVGVISNGPDDTPHHAVINAENYHALQLLAYVYEEQVDCIYIDPPYNTGARDWKYNNRYVDDNDTWRHSKWLAMMHRRLRVARRLLRKDGVLIVTVGEHEVHHLGVLLESVFPGYHRYMITIVHNPKGTYKSNFARVDEYAFYCVPPTEPGEPDVVVPLPNGLFNQVANPDAMTEGPTEVAEDLYLRRRGTESGYRHQRPNQFYAILVDEEAQDVVGVGPLLGAEDSYETSRDGPIVTVYPLDTRNQERVWRYSRETMRKLIAEGSIVITGRSTRTGQGWILQHRVRRANVKRLKTVWWEKRHDAGAHGSDLLTEYLGEPGLFPFPKSVYAVRDCIKAVTHDRPDALIVDFFAGSGTALHAVALLNHEDAGRRRCVMVTNNEVDDKTARRLRAAGLLPGDPDYEVAGIFEAVTAPRTRAVLTGLKPDGTPVSGEHTWAPDRLPYSSGFSQNAELFRIDYLDPDEVDLGRQYAAIAPLLWLGAGGTGPREETPHGSWSMPDGSTYAVLFDEGAAAEFVDEVAERPEISHAYIVTDSTDAFAEIRAELPSHVRNSSMLYRDYLRNFRINAGGSQ